MGRSHKAERLCPLGGAFWGLSATGGLLRIVCLQLQSRNPSGLLYAKVWQPVP